MSSAIKRPVTATATGAGNTQVVAPKAGGRLRVTYLLTAADPSNGASVVAAFRFGASGPLFYAHSLNKAGGMFSHALDNNEGFLLGGVDEPLFVWLAADPLGSVFASVDIV